LKNPGKIIVWPANLDSAKSKIEGRKVAKAIAVQAPRPEEINEAAKRLSLEAELVLGKSRPSSWWEKAGYVIVTKKGTKTNVFRALAGEIRKIRATKLEKEERSH
jgi:signal recognition particle subunit SRP19